MNILMFINVKILFVNVNFSGLTKEWQMEFKDAIEQGVKLLDILQYANRTWDSPEAMGCTEKQYKGNICYAFILLWYSLNFFI